MMPTDGGIARYEPGRGALGGQRIALEFCLKVVKSFRLIPADARDM
jgi:hypothetical protein